MTDITAETAIEVPMNTSPSSLIFTLEIKTTSDKVPYCCRDVVIDDLDDKTSSSYENVVYYAGRMVNSSVSVLSNYLNANYYKFNVDDDPNDYNVQFRTYNFKLSKQSRMPEKGEFVSSANKLTAILTDLFLEGLCILDPHIFDNSVVCRDVSWMYSKQHDYNCFVVNFWGNSETRPGQTLMDAFHIGYAKYGENFNGIRSMYFGMKAWLKSHGFEVFSSAE